ncbi:MAG: exo-alpha-sialidase [Bacteroidales bacterium]|nr:exo-alpha-sialidase [Bacteroidales bacterium]
MKPLYIYLPLFLFALAIGTLRADRVVSYARADQNVTLELEWGPSNYGTIQWQQSFDDGATWQDITGATTTSYTFKASRNGLYRAHVEGDPSCPAIDAERELRLVTFNCDVNTVSANGAQLEVSDLELNGAEVVEYGYAASLSGLARNYRLMARTPSGNVLPEGDITIECHDLLPNERYNVRVYFKTADGSLIFGPGKLVTTLAGLQWSTEDWTIEKHELQARFSITPSGTYVTDVKCAFGPSAEQLQDVEVNDLGSKKYASALLTGLQAGTDYVMRISAMVDGEEQVLTRIVRTRTDYSGYEVDQTVKPVSHKIVWDDDRTLTQLSPDGIHVEYPRICRIDANHLLLSYHGGAVDHWKHSYLRHSYDNGQTWTDPVTIYDADKSFLGSGYYRICNPEMTRLQNGWILLSVVANANPETNQNCKVLACISKDGGETWSDPIIVGRGRTWEPQVVQLPGGELELLVSSEAAWWQQGGGLYQEILCSRSTDNGQTWTAYKRAAYYPRRRDGMPVCTVMQGNKGLCFIIESVNNDVSPYIVHRDLDGEWDDADWDGQADADRWPAGLYESFSGAPYAIQLPTGEFVTMAHNHQTGEVWQTNRPCVVMADSECRNFARRQYPLMQCNQLKGTVGAYYNSFFLKDDDTLWLLITRAKYDGQTRVDSQIMYLEGKIVPLDQ